MNPYVCMLIEKNNPLILISNIDVVLTRQREKIYIYAACYAIQGPVGKKKTHSILCNQGPPGSIRAYLFLPFLSLNVPLWLGEGRCTLILGWCILDWVGVGVGVGVGALGSLFLSLWLCVSRPSRSRTHFSQKAGCPCQQRCKRTGGPACLLPRRAWGQGCTSV